ncbi:hypothetical protein [Pilimelia columellifera]|uniref:Uncharacterized protein n=1 Tax=Pilimelia columellifera subsp. columellifera TaxID=706583 RepID=A0ABP6B2A1_9ACTN
MRLSRTLATVIATATLCITLPATPATADADLVPEIVAEMGMGMTEQQFRTDLAVAARHLNATEDDVAQRVLTELKAKQVDGTFIPFAHTLPEARAAGDIAYVPAPYGGIYGSMMIYATRSTVMDFVAGKIVQRPVGEVKVARFTRLLSVDRPDQRRHAAAWAKAQAGKSYDHNFAINKVGLADDRLGVAELIWRAYRYEGVNLDDDGGIGAYPIDIYNHPDVTSYKVIKP